MGQSQEDGDHRIRQRGDGQRQAPSLGTEAAAAQPNGAAQGRHHGDDAAGNLRQGSNLRQQYAPAQQEEQAQPDQRGPGGLGGQLVHADEEGGVHHQGKGAQGGAPAAKEQAQPHRDGQVQPQAAQRVLQGAEAGAQLMQRLLQGFPRLAGDAQGILAGMLAGGEEHVRLGVEVRQLQQGQEAGDVRLLRAGGDHDGETHRAQGGKLLHSGDVNAFPKAAKPQEDGLLALQGGGVGHHAAVALGDVGRRVGNAQVVVVLHGAGVALPDGGAQIGHIGARAHVVPAGSHAVPDGQHGDGALHLPGHDGVLAAHAVGLDVQALHGGQDGGTVRRVKLVSGEGHGSAQQQRAGAQTDAEAFRRVNGLSRRPQPRALPDEGRIHLDGLAQGVLGARGTLVACPEGPPQMQPIHRQQSGAQQQEGQQIADPQEDQRQHQQRRAQGDPFAAAVP